MPHSNRPGQRRPTRGTPLGTPVTCLAILAVLAACEALAPPSPLPDNAVAISAPQSYQEWWAKTEACSGRRGNLRHIEWYVVPDVSEFMTSQGEKVGLWSHSSAGVRIVIAGDYLESELVVRHEMLHALLDQEGHPPEYFVDKCHLTWESWQGGGE